MTHECLESGNSFADVDIRCEGTCKIHIQVSRVRPISNYGSSTIHANMQVHITYIYVYVHTQACTCVYIYRYVSK